ncbi:hypothetical protein LJR074_003221 [Acidovorax sp. LjRoot74]|uniref:hypothetical protein n=1 Tax=Acidovorax sp. LjRoot74 TaxID=3342337 RepID=UPI003ECF18E6
MAEFAYDMEAHRRIKAIESRLEGGGGPPHNEDMDARLAKLEALIPTLSTKEEVVKLRGETREGFESVRGEIKASVEGVRSDMHKNTSEIIKWVVGTAIAISMAAITIITFVLNNATPKQLPTAQPPIIITVPQGYERGNGTPALPAKP